MKLEEQKIFWQFKMQLADGVKGIFTAHGSNMEEINLNPNLRSIIRNKLIQKVIFLNKSHNCEDIVRINN